MLMCRGRVDLAQRLLEAQRAVTDRQPRRFCQTTFSQAREQLFPTGLRLSMTIFDGYQFLVAMCRDTNDYQQTETIIHADVAVDAICPPVDVAAARQVPLTLGLVFVEPLGFQSRDRVGRQALRLVTQQSRQRLLIIARLSQVISSSTLRARFR